MRDQVQEGSSARTRAGSGDGRADPDSRARTHLANERTFLAWLRTGLAMITLGLAAGQFLEKYIEPGIPIVRTLSLGLITFGAVITIGGGRRYQANRRHIDRGQFRPASQSVIASTLLVVLVGLLAIIYLLIHFN